MDYDEQHRICEKEFEVDEAYTVAMDAMPEHWKEEADAQFTYLRHMHMDYVGLYSSGRKRQMPVELSHSHMVNKYGKYGKYA